MQRYRVVRELGRGGMGSVVLVHDEARGRDVALKRMRVDDPRAVVRFKREFRLVARLSHSNLVRLYELGEDDDGLFFTMEPVHGHDFRTACRNDPSSLGDLVAQLVDAIACLHAAGIVHGDLKPSNVLVRSDGTLKVLDFGVATEVAHPRREARTVAGTPGYIAPEVLRGEGAQLASDVFSLGVMLSEVVPSDEVALRALCDAALSEDPGNRPTIGTVARAVAPQHRRSSGVVSSALIGRRVLQEELSLLCDEHRLVALRGPTGSGKSTLATVYGRSLEDRGRLVLRGAARPSERVAFNALDGVIDDLAVLLATQSSDDSLRDARTAAATSFPALSAESPRERARQRVRAALFGGSSTSEAPLTRHAVFNAIATILHALARRAEAPITILIDDFQWADDDSLALLTHLVDAGEPSLRFLLSTRDDVEPGAALAWLEARGDDVRVAPVPPLDDADMARIARTAAGDAATELSDEDLRALLGWCRGRPFLAELVGRALSTGETATESAEAIVGSAINHASLFERALLSVLVAADGWLPIRVAADLVQAAPGDVEEAVLRLERAGVVRQGGLRGLDGTVDVYHEGVRRIALSITSAEELRRAHSAFADRLASEAAPTERLVRHLVAAERHREASAAARDAAGSAERRRAFSLAADLYEIALEEPSDDHDALTEARAFALERSGRHAEAARMWQQLVSRASPERRTSLLLHEAHALIAAAKTAEGLVRLDDALRSSGEVGIGTGGLRAARTVIGFVLNPFRPRSSRSGSVDRPAILAAERDVKVGILLSFLDPLTGIAFLQRAQKRFERAGAFEQAALCDYTFAVHALIGSRNIHRVRLAEGYRRRAEQRLRGRAAERPELRGMPHFIDGLTALRRGVWDVARTELTRAAALFADCGATSEHMMARSWGMMADVYTQDLPAMKRHLAWFRRNLGECGDTLIVAHVELLAGYILILEGRFDEGRRTVDGIRRLFPGASHDTQRDGALLYRYQSDIYDGDPRAARREYEAALKSVRRQRFLSTMYAGAFAMIGGLLEANALRVGDRDAALERVFEFAKITEGSPPLCAGASDRARAYAADARGQSAEAIVLLATAEEVATRYGRRVDAAIARFQRGDRLGGETGALLRREAHAVVESLGASPMILHEDVGRR